jgi:hypothetical protein
VEPCAPVIVLQRSAALGQRLVEQRSPRPSKQVEDDELSRGFPREQPDAALRRMQAQLQGFERPGRDHQLSIQHEIIA